MFWWLFLWQLAFKSISPYNFDKIRKIYIYIFNSLFSSKIKSSLFKKKYVYISICCQKRKCLLFFFFFTLMESREDSLLVFFDMYVSVVWYVTSIYFSSSVVCVFYYFITIYTLGCVLHERCTHIYNNSSFQLVVKKLIFDFLI